GLGCDRADRWGTSKQPTLEEIYSRLATPTAERIWFIRYAFKAGLTLEDIQGLTKIDPWFLQNIQEIIQFEEQLRAEAQVPKRLIDLRFSLLLKAKQFGFSDRQLAFIWHTTEAEVRRVRKSRGIEPCYKLVDTCAAEFEAYS